MSNNLQEENKSNSTNNKNLKYILILSGAVLVVVGLILLFTKVIPNNNTNNSTTAGAVISVINEEGKQDETISGDITFRDIKFGSTIKKIRKMENKLNDTLGNPTSATSNDGYTYLTYSFDKQASPEFFGATISTASNSAMLVYVFHNDSLIEVRVQYGSIGEEGYNTILASNNNVYGNATYSRSYSNGAKQSWWKTSDVTLDVIYQDGDVMAYYRTNNR